MLATYRELHAKIVQSYDAPKRASEAADDLPSFYLYRPLSFYMTPFFMWRGWSANAVTVLGLLLSLSLPVAVWMSGSYAPWVVVAIAFMVQILDCVDGNLARAQAEQSAVGQMLDGISTLLFWSSYFIALGMMVEHEARSAYSIYGFEVGLGLALLLLVQRELEDTFDSYFKERVRWEPPTAQVLQASGISLSRLGRLIEHLFAFGLLLVAHRLHAVYMFLLALSLYQGTLFVLWVVRFGRAVAERMQQAANSR